MIDFLVCRGLPEILADGHQSHHPTDSANFLVGFLALSFPGLNGSCQRGIVASQNPYDRGRIAARHANCIKLDSRGFLWFCTSGGLSRFDGYGFTNYTTEPQDTDYTGHYFWLTKLNNFNGNYIDAEIGQAFITSIEYRQRSGP